MSTGGSWSDRFAIIAATVFFLVGAFFIWHGVSANGSVDISALFVSGRVESGSAGLFMVFFSAIIILTVHLRQGKRPLPDGSRFGRQLLLLGLVLGIISIAAWSITKVQGAAVTPLMVVAGSLAMMLPTLVGELMDTARSTRPPTSTPRAEDGAGSKPESVSGRNQP